jgi:hypothetical protein
MDCKLKKPEQKIGATPREKYYESVRKEGLGDYG